jgi:peroxiredoxin
MKIFIAMIHYILKPKYKIRLALFFCLFTYQACTKPPVTEPAAEDFTAEEILALSNKYIADISIINYDVKYIRKSEMSDDTSTFTSNCTLMRDTSDILLGFKAHMVGKGWEQVYTGDEAYNLSHEDKLVHVYDPVRDGIKSLTGHVIRYMIVDRLIKGFDVSALTNAPAVVSRNLQEESPEFYVVSRTRPSRQESGFDGDTLKFWINKTTFLPEKVMYITTNDGNSQYEITVISNIVVNSSKYATHFREVTFPKDYKIEYYQPPLLSEFKMLEKGSPAPDFNLMNMQGEKVKLSDFRGKVVVLDFWYLSCYPCLQAMPHLNALYQAYASKGLVVLGINSKDNPIRKEKINTYLSRKEIMYPTLLASEATDNAFLVKAYPTIYVIGADGKVLASHIGFNDSMISKLEAVIVPALE